MYVFDLYRTSGFVSLIIFSGQSEGDDREYGSKIDAILKSRGPAYSDIIFVCAKDMENHVKTLIDSDGSFTGNIRRYGDYVPVFFFTFDDYGVLNNFSSMNASASEKAALEGIPAKIATTGINELARSRRSSVILKSPPGTKFKKPSGGVYLEFIKTSELAVNYSEVQFVAFCLLRKRPRNIEVSDIWIDTSGISVYIECLISYIQRLGPTTRKPIRYMSFQSYGGYRKAEPARKDNTWVVISASTSNNLGKRVYTEWSGITHNQIVTILSYKSSAVDLNGGPAEPGDRILANISSLSDARDQEKWYGSDIEVKVVGETFTAQIKKPNPVLVKRSHNTPCVKNFLGKYPNCKGLYAFKSCGKKTRAICLDVAEATSGEQGKKLDKSVSGWIERLANWYIPQGVSHLCYDLDDPASQQLANKLKSSIKGGFMLTEVNLSLEGVEIGNMNSVIVIVPVVSSGRTFLKVNRDLRMLSHQGQRVFINPFALFPSKGQFDRFRKSLVQAPCDQRYLYLNFEAMFLGHTDGEVSWERELEFVQQLKEKVWQDRTQALRKQSMGLTDEIGFCGTYSTNRLEFNQDFAFWSEGYKAEKVNHVTVYLTIASVLQGLREKPHSEVDTDALYSHVYQRAVIDPENFSRFNDPLIQSCLWRAGRDSELDYSDARDLSRVFTDILKRLAVEFAKGAPNAFSDILIGIAIGKIKLETTHLEDLMSFVAELQCSPEWLTELLHHIETNVLDLDNVYAKEDEPI